VIFMSVFESIGALARSKGISDIHIQNNSPLRYREAGILKVHEESVPDGFIEKLLSARLEKDELESFSANGDVDFSLEIGDLRFRVNAFKASAGSGAVMRLIASSTPSITELGLPLAVTRAIENSHGLILVTGATGSGKSTSLASMIRYLNENYAYNIITIEDPIEFVHNSSSSHIIQRQLGADANSFARSLRAALRQDPDVILVGELRDVETISLALTAAETGHLVLATLHTSTAVGAVTRILDVFPAAQQNQVRVQLAQSLLLVLTQNLHRKIDGSGRVASFEVLVNTPPVANLIRENKVYQIENVMQTARADGMVTMQNAIQELLSRGIISGE